MTADDRTIHQRIADAYRDIAATDFTKSGTVKVGGRESYGFIPIGQILQAVRDAHARHGIFTIFGRPEFDVQASEKRYSYTKKSPYDGRETTWVAANGHIDVRICGAGGDCIEVTVPCEAQDNSDKLTNKLITNAERCLYRTLYAIDEGDATDPEAFNEPRESDPFFGRNARREKAPQAAVKAAGADAEFLDGQALVEMYDSAKAQVDVKHARQQISQVYRESPGALGRWVAKNGQRHPAEWSDDDIRACYVDLMQEGSE